jgi:hypothetical protein
MHQAMTEVFQNPAFRKYVLPFLLIVCVLGAWEFSKPRRPAAAPKQAEDYGPPPPNNRNEEMWKDNRRSLRTSTLKALDQPSVNLCQPQGRLQLVNSVKGYFYFRDGSEMSYPLRWGDVGKQYITREWASADDRRIEQLIKDLYYRGYLDPKALDETAARRVAALVKGLAVNGRPCPA